MDSKSKAELNNIKRELNSIICELNSISNGVSRNFEGIDSKVCSKSIDMVINNCIIAQRKLNYLDTSTVTASYKKSKK